MVFSRPFYTGAATEQPFLTPQETWSIDTKIDDGRPATGIMITDKSTSSFAPGCSTTNVAATSAYALSVDVQLCKFVVKMGF